MALISHLELLVIKAYHRELWLKHIQSNHRHVRLMHMENKMAQCRVCFKWLKNSLSLKCHMRDIHNVRGGTISETTMPVPGWNS